MITSSVSLYQVPACCCSSALNVEGGVLGIVSFANYLLSPVRSPWANSLPRCFWEHLYGQCKIAGGPVVTVQCAQRVKNLCPSVYGFFLKSSVKNRRQIWEIFSLYKICQWKTEDSCSSDLGKICVFFMLLGFLIKKKKMLIVLSCDFRRREVCRYQKSIGMICKLK